MLSAARTIQACKLKRTSKLEKKGKREKGERATKGQCWLRQSPVGSFLKDQQGYRQRQQQRRWRQRVANEIKGEQTSYGQTISNGPKGHWIRTTDKGRQGNATRDEGRRTRDDGQRTLFPWPLLKAISFGHAHPERLPASSLFSVFVRSVQDLPLGAEIDLCCHCSSCLPLPLSVSPSPSASLFVGLPAL